MPIRGFGNLEVAAAFARGAELAERGDVLMGSSSPCAAGASMSGEAGIGMSRIVSAFRERISAQSHTWLRYQGSPYYTNSALYPVIEQLALAARIESNDDPARKLAKLEELLAVSGRPLLYGTEMVEACHERSFDRGGNGESGSRSPVCRLMPDLPRKRRVIG